MPTYKYKCTHNHVFEKAQKMLDKPLEKCEIKDCEAKVSRLPFANPFILKGDGWTK